MKSKLTADAQVTLLLCSHLSVPKGTGTKLQPLSVTEWNQLAKKLVDKGLRPGCLLELERDRLQREPELSVECADRLAAERSLARPVVSPDLTRPAVEELGQWPIPNSW